MFSDAGHNCNTEDQGEGEPDEGGTLCDIGSSYKPLYTACCWCGVSSDILLEVSVLHRQKRHHSIR